jgi:hypothetical protein
MRSILSAFLVLTVLVPSAASAAEPISRRDGFLMLWSAISRPAEPWKKDAFDDVPSGAPGYAEITFARGRGLLDGTFDGNDFRPDAALTGRDAYLWLVRTRNADLPENLTPESLTGTLKRYGLEPDGAELAGDVSADQLLEAMRTFDANLASTVVMSSNYGEEFQGDHTAFGEIFDWHLLTAAHRTLPYNTLVRVTNTETGMSTIVRINDRGPYVDGRGLDLSVAAFQAIAPGDSGVIPVTIERLGDASLVGPCTKEQRYARRVAPGTVITPGIPNVLRLGQELRIQSRQWFVVRSVTYPGGDAENFQDWVAPGEEFALKPSVAGDYVFTLGDADGRSRSVKREVADCSDQPGA